MNKTTTSARLKQIMADRGLKQIDILNLAKPYAEKYNMKLGSNDLSQYVTGKVEPSQYKLTLLAETLGVNPAWLMGFDVPMKKETTYYDKQLIKTAEDFIATKEEFFGELKKMIKDYYDLTGDQLNNVIEYIEFLKSKK